MSITEKRILRKAARLIDLQRTDIHGAILKHELWNQHLTKQNCFGTSVATHSGEEIIV
jgi:hypothetical protein